MTFGYLRVSTDKQDAAAQKIGIEELAKRRGLQIDKYIDDEGISGVKDAFFVQNCPKTVRECPNA